jgi:alpha-tubulin suppressor-like RCC1 family protein
MFRLTWIVSTVSAVLLWTNGCSNIPSEPASNSSDSIPGLIVSSSVRGAGGVGGFAAASRGAAEAGSGTVFVSLPPGSVAEGLQATIRDQVTGATVTVPVLDGGFDPVAVAGNIGDTLKVDVMRTGSLGTIHDWEVVASRPPVVVRTIPPPGKADVPLNVVVIVIFSEPIDPVTLTWNSLRLLQGATPIDGSVSFADPDQVSVVFTASALLAPHTAYRLVATSAIADLGGSNLEADFQADFTTGTTVTSGVASVSILPGTATVSLGEDFQLVSEVRDAGGATVPGTPVIWASDDTTVATVSTAGLVTSQGLGAVTISASADGRAGTAHISIVRPPSPTGLAFASVSAGDRHACGLTPGGRAYCWGENSLGQLGDGTWTSSATPVAVLGGLTFRSISAGHWFNCGITTSDEAWCWGDNPVGELGNGESGNGTWCCRLRPVAVAGGLSFRSVSASTTEEFACGVTTSRRVHCWGANQQVPGGFYGSSNAPVEVSGGLEFGAVSTGQFHTCALTPSGEAYCWGYNRFGAVGSEATGLDAWVLSPVAVAGGLTFASINASASFSCGVTTDGTDYCWGADFANFPTDAAPLQVCDIDNCNRYFPAPVALTLNPSLTTLSIQSLHSCGLTPSGRAWCWGWNGSGVLGNGTTIESAAAVPVSGGLSFASISVGNSFACGVTSGRVAYCWGSNASSQLGNGTSTNSSVPVKVAGQQ